MEKKDLKPAGVFHYFEEICQVPRPSKHEEKIVAYLKEFGKKHHLETLSDEVGNVLIKKPATPGMENRKTVVLQSHVDMVCEKNNDVQHDFMNDPIQTEVDGEWLKAKGTTLGADNGIGVATELAILADDTIEHGPLECLFTIDEETGLTGAFALKEGFMNGDILLNLDSEDEGELFIGCAGGVDSVAEFKYQETTENSVLFAQYDAKQIYYSAVSNRGEKYDPAIQPTLNMYNEYFGGGMNSIVFQEMREARSLAYSAGAFLISPSKLDRPYVYRTFIATQNDKMIDALKAFDEIINNMPESERAFNVAKEALITRLRTDRITKENILWSYLDAQELGQNVDSRKQLFEEAQNMTLSDIKAFQITKLSKEDLFGY